LNKIYSQISQFLVAKEDNILCCSHHKYVVALHVHQEIKNENEN